MNKPESMHGWRFDESIDNIANKLNEPDKHKDYEILYIQACRRNSYLLERCRRAEADRDLMKPYADLYVDERGENAPWRNNGMV